MAEEALDFLKKRQKLNLCIILINIGIYLYMELAGSTQNTLFMVEHGAMYVPYVLERGEYYRIFTSMFLHFGVEHLGSNMLLLLFAGDILEKEAGKTAYLMIYLGGGILGNLLSMMMDLKSGEFVVSAGASGAIFAVVGALVWLVYLNRKELGESYVKRVLVIAALTLADGFTQTGIDGYAHFGGFAGGVIICILLTGITKIVRGKIKR